MPKNFKIWSVSLLAILIILTLYGKVFYRNVIKANRDHFPTFIENWINNYETNNKKPDVVVYKPEETIKILEGWTESDIVAYFESLGKWSKSDLEKTLVQFSDNNQATSSSLLNLKKRFSFLNDKPEDANLEGFLFPDTYRIYSDASLDDVIIKMLENFDKKLTVKMREDIKNQGKTVYEVMIMASLIEKEAPINYQDKENTDARIVSDIFWGRLSSNQALQSDATLSYILNDNNPAHSGKDLEIESPYNSYKYRGLPPTPICNPGLKAIEAAIYPIKTNYNYFLTSLDGNNIYYAVTYQEHLNNKYKYLK